MTNRSEQAATPCTPKLRNWVSGSEFLRLFGRARPAFLETLARFRPSLDVLAAHQAVENRNEPILTPRVPAEWYHTRAVGRLRLTTRQRWLDLRSFQTRQALRHELAQTLLDLGFGDLDLSGVVGPKRRLTQAIACWAHDYGYAGLVYSNRFDAALTCSAIFEGATFGPVGSSEPILPNDPDLIAMAKPFGLSL